MIICFVDYCASASFVARCPMGMQISRLQIYVFSMNYTGVCEKNVLEEILPAKEWIRKRTVAL
jgi:hypothetical protein